MQYLLPQEEYDALVNKGKNDKRRLKDAMQYLCTNVCDLMPVQRRFGHKEGDPLTPWGCILTKKGGYCDCCPVQDVCPHEYKEYSK